MQALGGEESSDDGSVPTGALSEPTTAGKRQQFKNKLPQVFPKIGDRSTEVTPDAVAQMVKIIAQRKMSPEQLAEFVAALKARKNFSGATTKAIVEQVKESCDRETTTFGSSSSRKK